MPEYSLDLVVFPLLPQAEKNGEDASRLRPEIRAAERTIWLWFSHHLLKKNEDLCRNICFFPLYKLTDLFVKPHSVINRKLSKREAGKIIKHWNLLVIYSRNKNLGRPKVSKCAIPHIFSQNTLFRWLLCHPTTNLNGNQSLSLSISLQNLPATLKIMVISVIIL